MKLEVLFPEYGNLFGDYGNILYLQACLPDMEVVKTAMNDTPRFLSEPVQLVYLGPMSEAAQEKVIDRLMPYRERVSQLVEEGTCFLFTGNAMEVLFREIRDSGRRIPGLGLFDFSAERDYNHRYNANFLGEFQGEPLLGCKTQFTMAYGDNSQMYFAKAVRGVGMNRDTPFEGICRNNFFGTYLVGPLLVMNPGFTRTLLERMGVREPRLAYEAAMEEAFEKRLAEFRDPAVKMEKEGDTNQIRIDFTPKVLYNKVKSKIQHRNKA